MANTSVSFWHRRSLTDRVLSLFKQTPMLNSDSLSKSIDLLKKSANEIGTSVKTDLSDKVVKQKGAMAILVFNIMIAAMFGDGNLELAPERVRDLRDSILSEQILKPIEDPNDAKRLANTAAKRQMQLSANQQALGQLIRLERQSDTEREKALEAVTEVSRYRMGMSAGG